MAVKAPVAVSTTTWWRNAATITAVPCRNGFLINPPLFVLRLPPPNLRWNVASLALAQGITNPSRLAIRLHMGRQGLYAIWNGTAGQVAIAMLGRLAHLFQVEPGDWFVWEAGAEGQGSQTSPHPLSPRPHPSSPRLLWNVAA